MYVKLIDSSDPIVADFKKFVADQIEKKKSSSAVRLSWLSLALFLLFFSLLFFVRITFVFGSMSFLLYTVLWYSFLVIALAFLIFLFSLVFLLEVLNFEIFAFLILNKFMQMLQKRSLSTLTFGLGLCVFFIGYFITKKND